MNRVFEEQSEINKDKVLNLASKELAEQYGKSKEWIFRSMKYLEKKHTESSIEDLKKIMIQNYLEKK